MRPTDTPPEQCAYCLTCGYDLRGLPEDPCICPECGRSYSRAELLACRDRIGYASRSLNAIALTTCPLSVFVLVAYRVSDAGFVMWLAGPVLLAVLLGVTRYAKRTRGAPRRWLVLLECVLYGNLWALAVCGIAEVGLRMWRATTAISPLAKCMVALAIIGTGVICGSLMCALVVVRVVRLAQKLARLE